MDSTREDNRKKSPELRAANTPDTHCTAKEACTNKFIYMFVYLLFNYCAHIYIYIYVNVCKHVRVTTIYRVQEPFERISSVLSF